jgi:hypothetical protein
MACISLLWFYTFAAAISWKIVNLHLFREMVSSLTVHKQPLPLSSAEKAKTPMRTLEVDADVPPLEL